MPSFTDQLRRLLPPIGSMVAVLAGWAGVELCEGPELPEAFKLLTIAGDSRAEMWNPRSFR